MFRMRVSLASGLGFGCRVKEVKSWVCHTFEKPYLHDGIRYRLEIWYRCV